jgi:hypothetical protein
VFLIFYRYCQATHVFVIFGEHGIFKANPCFDASLCNKAKIPSERNQSSATGGFGGFLHLCNESTISSFGFEGYFVSNFYSASVVSQSNCIVAKADCRQVLSAIQNVDFINTIRSSALARTQWLAMRSHQAVQVMGTAKPIQRASNYLQSVRMQNFLGTQSYPKGPYRKALMNKDDYDAITLRWRDARQDLQQNRLRKFLLVETPLPQVACLYASSVQSSAARSKKMEKSQTLLNATQVHGSPHACIDQVFREARVKPWIAEATAIMKFRKSMNPRASAEDMLRTSSCSRIAAQGFSKVRTYDKQIFNRFVLNADSGCAAYDWLSRICRYPSHKGN